MPRNFIRAILFDFGGTLMYGRRDWTPVVAKADDLLAEHLRTQGMEINPGTFPIEFRKKLDDYFKQREEDLLETTYTSVLRELLKDKGYDDVGSDVIRGALDTLFSVTEHLYIPIHHQMRPWAMKQGVTTVHRSDDRPEARFTSVK